VRSGLKRAGFAISALAGLGIYMTQVGPDDAVSNLSKWWGKFGPVPNWVKEPAVDGWGSLIFAALLVVGLLPTILTFNTKDPSPTAIRRRRWWQRKSPLKLSLERDSGSDQFGVHSFPGISYIQVAVSTSIQVDKCRAWITSSEYDVGSLHFSLEHNERLPCGWSKHSGNDQYQVDILPNEPPIRFNVLVFNQSGIQHDLGMPTNWLERLQRPGLHRLTLIIAGQCQGRGVQTLAHLFVDWSGDGHAYVTLEQS